jgi:hypothetical protein
MDDLEYIKRQIEKINESSEFATSNDEIQQIVDDLVRNVSEYLRNTNYGNSAQVWNTIMKNATRTLKGHGLI